MANDNTLLKWKDLKYYDEKLDLVIDDLKPVFLTQAEYDALGDEKYTNGVKYIITDAQEIINPGSLTIDDTLSDTSENPVQNKVITEALNDKANKNDIPTSLPANGGNAATVGGHTVEANVPADAKFTDTTYDDATTTKAGLMGIGAQVFAGNKAFTGQVFPNGASALGTAQARKIYAGTEDMEAGVSTLETGDIYLVYE